jgi:hypothetical protein
MPSQRPRRSSQELKAVTAERAARLHHLLKLLVRGPQTRDRLVQRLRLDVRGFYRDLELLRESGIDLPLVDRRYVLRGKIVDAVARLPFPDPHLTLGEAMALAKGRSPTHRKLKAQIEAIVR